LHLPQHERVFAVFVEFLARQNKECQRIAENAQTHDNRTDDQIIPIRIEGLRSHSDGAIQHRRVQHRCCGLHVAGLIV